MTSDGESSWDELSIQSAQESPELVDLSDIGLSTVMTAIRNIQWDAGDSELELAPEICSEPPIDASVGIFGSEITVEQLIDDSVVLSEIYDSSPSSEASVGGVEAAAGPPIEGIFDIPSPVPTVRSTEFVQPWAADFNALETPASAVRRQLSQNATDRNCPLRAADVVPAIHQALSHLPKTQSKKALKVVAADKKHKLLPFGRYNHPVVLKEAESPLTVDFSRTPITTFAEVAPVISACVSGLSQTQAVKALGAVAASYRCKVVHKSRVQGFGLEPQLLQVYKALHSESSQPQPLHAVHPPPRHNAEDANVNQLLATFNEIFTGSHQEVLGRLSELLTALSIERALLSAGCGPGGLEGANGLPLVPEAHAAASGLESQSMRNSPRHALPRQSVVTEQKRGPSPPSSNPAITSLNRALAQLKKQRVGANSEQNELISEQCRYLLKQKAAIKASCGSDSLEELRSALESVQLNT